MILANELIKHKLITSIPFRTGIFGGAVRAWLTGRVPRDIDVAVDCTQRELDELINEISSVAKLNRFGGYKFSYEGSVYDLWPLMESWAIKDADVDWTFRNLAITASYNADCLVYNLEDGLYDFGWSEAKSTGLLRLNYQNNPHHFFNALRGVGICVRYDLEPTKGCKEYILEHLPEHKRATAARKYRDQYGRELYVDMERLKI